MTTGKWIAVGVVVILVALGLWWWVGSQPGTAGNSPTASSTNETASTTTSSETSGAQAVRVQSSTGTVASIIAGLSLGSHFNSLLNSTGVAASLNGSGPYTVFVATDGAFTRLPPGTIEAMSSAELKRMIQYHVVSGKMLDPDAVNSGMIEALSKDTINFNVDASTTAVFVNSGYVLAAYRASNGIVYVINSVLLPPQKNPATL